MRVLMFAGILFSMTLGCCYGQLQHTSIEELEMKQDSVSQPVIIFIQTDWCRYCAALKNTTLKNKEVIDYLNANFYFVSLNGESKKSMIWKGSNYNFVPTGSNTGYHQLARLFGTVNGQLNYPVIAFLNEKLEIVHQEVGFIRSKKLMHLLKTVNTP